MIYDVTDLEVYKTAIDLLPELYKLLKEVPRSEFELINQIKSAALSIPANISEGFAKRSSLKEFKRYLLIALGSSDEVISHLRALKVIQGEYIVEIDQLTENYKLLSKRLNSMHKIWHH